MGETPVDDKRADDKVLEEGPSDYERELLGRFAASPQSEKAFDEWSNTPEGKKAMEAYNKAMEGYNKAMGFPTPQSDSQPSGKQRSFEEYWDAFTEALTGSPDQPSPEETPEQKPTGKNDLEVM